MKDAYGVVSPLRVSLNPHPEKALMSFRAAEIHMCSLDYVDPGRSGALGLGDS